MNSCLRCKKLTNNAKFCGLSCSVSFNNLGKKHGPPRKIDLYISCKICGIKTYRRNFCCDDHRRQARKARKVKNPLIKAKKLAGQKARKLYFETFPYKCVVCGYEKIIAVHHFIELNTVNSDKYDELCYIDNLAGLCLNHHEELHRKMISEDFVKEKKLAVDGHAF